MEDRTRLFSDANEQRINHALFTTSLKAREHLGEMFRVSIETIVVSRTMTATRYNSRIHFARINGSINNLCDEHKEERVDRAKRQKN